MPPYNVVLSRRHEPVEHSSTCARSLRRSRERGVVVREILWGGRGVTNTGGPQGRLQVRRGQCKRRQGSQAEHGRWRGERVEAEEGRRRGGNRHAVCVCAGAGRRPVKSRVKGRLLEARVEDPKSVETRKEIQVFRGMVAAITTHRAARTPVGSQTFSPF